MTADSQELIRLEKTRSHAMLRVYRIAPMPSAAMTAAVAHVAPAIQGKHVMRANVSVYQPAMERFVVLTAAEVAVVIAQRARAVMQSANASVNVFQPVKEKSVVQTVVEAHVAPAIPDNLVMLLDNAKLPPVVAK